MRNPKNVRFSKEQLMFGIKDDVHFWDMKKGKEACFIILFFVCDNSSLLCKKREI